MLLAHMYMQLCSHQVSRYTLAGMWHCRLVFSLPMIQNQDKDDGHCQENQDEEHAESAKNTTNDWTNEIPAAHVIHQFRGDIHGFGGSDCR